MIRKGQDCAIEYREHMRDGDGTVQITNFITGPEELNGKGRLFAKITLNPGCSIGYHLHDKDAELFYIIKGGTSIQVTPMLILVPLLILQMIILSVGFGIIIASVTTKYRDLAMLVSFGLQLWQYGSPIAYGLTLVPERALPIYMLNPMTPVVTTFRYAVFGFGYFHLSYYLIAWVISLGVFFIGLVLFSRIERTFMDTI